MAKEQTENGLENNEKESQSKGSTPWKLSIAKFLPQDRAGKELAMKMGAAIRENMHLETRSRNDENQLQAGGQNDFHPDTPSTSKAAINEQAT